MSTFDNETGRLPPQFQLKQRYIIIGQAGRGGMGAVYQAIDTQGGSRRVAIKEMSQAHLSDIELGEAAARFQREAELLSSLSHANLPHIYEAFSERGRYYLVMDFIEGKTLLQLIQDSGRRPLPVPQVLFYADQLCAVLGYLHTHQPPIIFRDLKPSNVMVRSDGRVFLIDFGIARFFKEGQEQDTTFLGSPGYASPEQHGIAQTNPRSDLYSLGATLYCCLTGKNPHQVNDHFTFPPMSQFNPHIPAALEILVQRLVAIDERQRPTNALEVQQMLTTVRQQAMDPTTGLAPNMTPATAPTQYMSPASPPPPIPLGPSIPFMQPTSAPSNAPLVLPPTVAITPAAPPINRITQQARPVQSRSPKARSSGSPTITSIWTRSFTTLFGLMLALTLGGSAIIFNTINGSDHSVEFGLSLLLFLVAVISRTMVRSSRPKSLLFFTALGALVAGLAFAIQALPILQQTANSFQITLLQFAFLNGVFTVGLAAAGLISLLWLTRQSTMIDRIVLLTIFGVATICALTQFASNDTDVLKHTLLLIALITLIQGLLMAAQMERVHNTA